MICYVQFYGSFESDVKRLSDDRIIVQISLKRLSDDRIMAQISSTTTCEHVTCQNDYIRSGSIKQKIGFISNFKSLFSSTFSNEVIFMIFKVLKFFKKLRKIANLKRGVFLRS